MNIDAIVMKEFVDVQLKHPVTDEPLLTSDGKPMWIRVCGSDSNHFRSVQARFRNEVLRNPNKKMTAEKEFARMTEILVACTFDWCIEGANGLIPFSADEARKLYTEKVWIRNQVINAIFDDTLYYSLGESKKG